MHHARTLLHCLQEAKKRDVKVSKRQDLERVQDDLGAVLGAKSLNVGLNTHFDRSHSPQY